VACGKSVTHGFQNPMPFSDGSQRFPLATHDPGQSMDFLSWMYERNTFYSKILSAKNKEPDEKYISEAKQECDIWPVHAIGATAFGISMPHSGFS